VSPILVRPVREQLEHDRVIRLLQLRLRRRYDVAINVGDEQAASVKIGNAVMFPDLVLTSTERGRQLAGVIEVETGESVNHLEAMAEWAQFSKVRAPFHLYVPAGAVDIARRLCSDHHVEAAEFWSYHAIGTQMRCTMVVRSPAQRDAARPRAAPARPRATAATARKTTARTSKARTSQAKSRPAARKTAREQKRK
jgi:hypothetical protein